MRKLQIRPFSLFCTLLLLLLTTHAFGLEASSSGAILPDGLIVEDVFKPGIGLPVGKVQLVQGEVIIIHADQMRGYLAKRNLPLYKSDAIITKEKGRIRIKLNDESVLTLASQTKLKITESVYDPTKKIRSSFFDMAIGKARFWAKKFTDYKQSLFKVKTHTAVVGVRGSEWIEEVTEDSTKVTALEDTTLEVISTAKPDLDPTILEDFKQTVVDEGEPPSGVVEVSKEEIEQMKKDFTVTPEGEEPDAKVELQKGKAEEKPAVEEGAEEAAETKKETDTTTETKKKAEEGTGVAALVPAILVSEDELVPVDNMTEGIGEGLDINIIIEDIETTIAIEEIDTTRDEVIEEQTPEETEGSITINW